jgi:hypothetical protein
MGRLLKRHHARSAHLGAVFGAINAPAALVWLYAETDKGQHGYLPYYRRHLGPLRWQRLLAFEIGVGLYESRTAGGSLPIWRDYLLRSRIVGIDIYPKDVAWGRRVAFAQADQNDPEQLQAVVDQHGRPDVVIDDGSHIGRHIVTSFRHLWPLLKPGGVYVVEDLSTTYAPDFEGGHPAPSVSGVGLVQQLVNELQVDDPAFVMYPHHATAPVPEYGGGVAAVYAYPGIVFIEKAT